MKKKKAIKPKNEKAKETKDIVEKAVKRAVEKKTTPDHSKWREDYRKKKLGLP